MPVLASEAQASLSETHSRLCDNVSALFAPERDGAGMSGK